jgi:hypothetical protein
VDCEERVSAAGPGMAQPVVNPRRAGRAPATPAVSRRELPRAS